MRLHETIVALAGLVLYVEAINSSDQNGRRLQEEPCTLLLRHTRYEDQADTQEVACVDPLTNDILAISGTESMKAGLLAMFNRNELISNESTMHSTNAYFTDNGQLLLSGGLDTVVFGEDASSRKSNPTIGTKSMLALRVIASDASTTSTANQISDAWFGTDGDNVNHKSQYYACSGDKLEFNPLVNSNGGIVNGVLTVSITETVDGTENTIIRSAATAKATSVLGADLFSEPDHVMVCIPPGTNGGWIAYAYINSSLSVYNDLWCNYVSAQMHEIGHNIGLAHSGESSSYDDQSGMMGYSYSDSDTLMCFNAPKNWQLGWYIDRQKILNAGSAEQIQINGVSDYKQTGDDDTILVQIPGGVTDWYVSFNRKDGFNDQTKEGGDQVLVHNRPTGVGYDESKLLAKLDSGGTYTGAPVRITVNSINLTASPPYATVTFGTISPQSNPTSSPPTSSPSMPPTGSCNENPKAKFLWRKKMKNGNLKISKRSCRWLGKKNENKIASFCKKKNKCHEDFGSAEDTCPDTCASCDPCYERETALFFVKKNKKEKHVVRNCGWLDGRDNKELLCQNTFVEGCYGLASEVCPGTCSVQQCTNAQGSIFNQD